jgi:hypothetical protein
MSGFPARYEAVCFECGDEIHLGEAMRLVPAPLELFDQTSVSVHEDCHGGEWDDEGDEVAP